MLKVNEANWKEYEYLAARTPIFERVMRNRPTALHLYWISEVYRRYRLGDWNNELPLPDTLSEKQCLHAHYDTVGIFHKKHKKFGSNIIEVSNPYDQRAFVFFDYQYLKLVFDALDSEKEVPHVPIYYAHPEDRFDYQNGTHMWE